MKLNDDSSIIHSDKREYIEKALTLLPDDFLGHTSKLKVSIHEKDSIWIDILPNSYHPNEIHLPEGAEVKIVHLGESPYFNFKYKDITYLIRKKEKD